MQALLIRTAFVTITVITAVLAVALLTGRVLATQLQDAQLNSWLETRGLAVVGARARWRLLNPVLEAQTLRLGASELSDVVVEFDWLESLLRWTPVLRHLSVAGSTLRVHFEPDRGWHLLGMPVSEQAFGWADTLYHSDELRFVGTLEFSRGEHPAELLEVDATVVNRGGSHRAQGWVTDPSCAQLCRLQVQFDDREALRPLWYRELAVSTKTHGQGVRVPAPLLAGVSARLAQFDLRWDRTATRLGSGIAADAGIGAGVNFKLRLEEVLLPGGDAFGLHLSGDGTSVGGVATASVRSSLRPVPMAADSASAYELPPLWLQWSPTHVRVFAAQLNVSELSEFLQDIRLPEDKLGIWLTALEAQGELRDVRVTRDHGTSALGYTADFFDVNLRGYRGVPLLRGATGSLSGHSYGIRALLSAPAATVGFPDQFDDPWDLRELSGEFVGVFTDGVTRISGRNIAGLFDEFDGGQPHRVIGSFDLAAPPERDEHLLVLQLGVSRSHVSKAKSFIPTKLGPGLRDWLLQAPQGGQLTDVRLGFFAYTRAGQGPRSRRVDLLGSLSDGRILYQAPWPVVADIGATLHLSGPRLEAQVSKATTQGLVLGASKLTIPADSGTLLFDLQAQFPLSDGLDFVRTTPLAKQLSFVESNWSGRGNVQAQGRLRVSLNQAAAALDQAAASVDQAAAPIIEAAAAPVSADLQFRFANNSLSLPSFRAELGQLRGELNFVSPNKVDGSQFSGVLFDSPVQAKLHTRNDNPAVVFDINGSVLPGDVYRLLNLSALDIANGQTDYQATLTFPLPQQAADATTASPSLVVNSNLVGIGLELPGQLYKSPGHSQPLTVTTLLGDQFQQVDLSYTDLLGRLNVVDGDIASGAMGFGVPLPTLAHGTGPIVVSGTLEHFDIAGTGSGTDNLLGPYSYEFSEFDIAQLASGTLQLGRVQVQGSMQGAAFNFALVGDNISGEVSTAANMPLRVRLNSLRLPAAQGEGLADPLEVGLIQQLPATDVELVSLLIGDEDFGQWRFKSRAEGSDLVVSDLISNFRGVAITAEQLVWRGDSNQSEFTGRVIAGNLAEVLPQWGYAASLETERADLAGSLHWPGSPVNFRLEQVKGEVVVDASKGHFLDLENAQNALRIFSLLNFSTLTKRMSFDFSDVLGRGLSFDDLSGQLELDQGSLRFLEPMEIVGTGSSFRLAGQVDIITGTLDNEMIVTLPVSKSLPWYATYVAIANPLAGLGVLIGGQVLRKPLERFSSAKYRISGSLEQPEVEFVGLFDQSLLQQPADTGGEVESKAPNTPQPADSEPTELPPEPEAAT